MQDYVKFVQQHPRYSQAVKHARSAHAYFSELQKAGYATDPKYAEKVLSVLESDQLKGYGNQPANIISARSNMK